MYKLGNEYNIDMEKIREYKSLSKLKRKDLAWHKNRIAIGQAQSNRRNADSNREFKHLKHFTRCELLKPLKNESERGHIYVINLNSDYARNQAKRNRVLHTCVFCGNTWYKTIFCQSPQDGIIVSDVINNDIVRNESKIRNIIIKYYDINQES